MDLGNEHIKEVIQSIRKDLRNPMKEWAKPLYTAVPLARSFRSPDRPVTPHWTVR